MDILKSIPPFHSSFKPIPASMFKRTLFFLLSVVPVLALAQFPVAKLDQAYQNLAADEQAKYAITSLCVLDAQTGKIFAVSFRWQ